MVAGVLLFGAGEPSWSQEKIGGAQTVVNNVDGNLPTGNQVPVVQGDNVFLNEAVRSGADSRAKLVLNDSTNLTVGPDFTVKLDDFVYSGPKAPGTIALNMTKGTLRFITGDANKRAYTIWTPTAAIGVRGTNLLIEASDTETKVVNEEGTAIVCARKRNEYVTVNELRKRCKGREEEQANIRIEEKVMSLHGPPSAKPVGHRDAGWNLGGGGAFERHRGSVSGKFRFRRVHSICGSRSRGRGAGRWRCGR